MPTDGTLLLEHVPKEKRYLVTALSVFFSIGAVISAVVAIFVLPQNSCPVSPHPCDVDVQNRGWKLLLMFLGLIVCIFLFIPEFFATTAIADIRYVSCANSFLSFIRISTILGTRRTTTRRYQIPSDDLQIQRV